MADLSGKARAIYVRQMFARLARRYDIANRWMAWCQDEKWRSDVIDQACLPIGGKLLDIGTGTGGMALEAVKRDRTLFTMGLDFTHEMMQQGRMRQGGESILWVNADALDLPIITGSFDAVVSGYLLRNVVDIERALAEQYRVLKWGGRVVSLDTTPPPPDIWHLPVRLYLRHIIPVIGGLITGDNNAYHYLPQSTERFIQEEELAGCMLRIGFKEVQYRCFMGGTMAIHWGVK
jgi:demethylmenaquinone methyltransferase/2-methoxy-6-polyprenyl-1,4-benzoquinol methylase